MAISDAQKIDLLFKKLAYGVTKTDTNAQKAATNEAIASPLLNRSDKLWSQSGSIPSVAPGSTTGVVKYYEVYELEADITASTNRTWLTNKTDWIPPEFGSTYQAKIYIHSANDSDNAVDISNQVFAAGSGNNDEWYFDYQAGVLNFIGTNLPSGISGNSVYIRAYVYNGNFGLSGGSAGFDSDQVVAIINENSQGLTDSDLKAIADLRNDVDSDSITIQNLQELIDGLRADADSDSLTIQSIQEQINVINNKIDSDSTATQSNTTRIEHLESALDSETARIQLLLLSTDSDALTLATLRQEADSDAAAIAILREQADSDATAIQALRTELQLDIDQLRLDADSDSIAIQALSIKSNVLAARLDSDEADISKLRADVDSDSIQIQQLRTDVEDSDFIINRTPFRLDDSTFTTTSSNQVLDTFDRNEHKTVKYIVSAKKDSDWQSSEVLVNHDGTNAYAMEYAIMDSGAGDLFIADADVSGETVRLLISPQTTNINVSIIRTQLD